MKNKMILFIILVLSLFLIVGCSQPTGDNNGQGEDGNQGDNVELTGEIKEFDIIAKSWEFVPATIEVNLGDKVELHVKSIDVTHGFMLPDFGINEQLNPNQDVHIEFIADKKGTFLFACSVPCGRGHGRMTGQLIVN